VSLGEDGHDVLAAHTFDDGEISDAQSIHDVPCGQINDLGKGSDAAMAGAVGVEGGIRGARCSGCCSESSISCPYSCLASVLGRGRGLSEGDEVACWVLDGKFAHAVEGGALGHYFPYVLHGG
jgi:hypothetical protein